MTDDPASTDAASDQEAVGGPRLHLNAELRAGVEIDLDRDASNYLFAVMRLAVGDALRVFNGRDGEWRAEAVNVNKRRGRLRLDARLRPPAPPPDLWLLFAPIKKARTDFIVEKAAELGCREIRPVITERTQSERVNVERLQAHAIEAAEQCELVFAPEVIAPQTLTHTLLQWDADRRLLFCDENRDAPPLAAAAATAPPPAAVLIGPEGGFTSAERALLRAAPFVAPATLGPRILRADTAAAAALAIWQDVSGDWRGG